MQSKRFMQVASLLTAKNGQTVASPLTAKEGVLPKASTSRGGVGEAATERGVVMRHGESQRSEEAQGRVVMRPEGDMVLPFDMSGSMGGREIGFHFRSIAMKRKGGGRRKGRKGGGKRRKFKR